MTREVPRTEMRDGNTIPQLGLGTYRLRGEECRRTVRTALEVGYEHIDTAEMYGNEPEIGGAIEGFDRSDLFLTSKVWPSNLRYEDVLDSCESSLEGLGTDYLDLYLIHWPSETVPLGETLDAMGRLHEEGKVRSVGVSNFSIRRIREAMEASDVPIVANQIEFHPLLHRRELLDFCRENDIVVIAYAPLARTRVSRDETVRAVAEEYGRTPAQIALRWEIQKEVIPIPKSSSEDHLRENIQIFDWELEPDDEGRIDSISRERRLVGPRSGGP